MPIQRLTGGGGVVDVSLNGRHGSSSAETGPQLGIKDRTSVDQPLNLFDLYVDLVDESAQAAHADTADR
ncbi:MULTISPECIES: hypothetical protein [unclassified Micromonospora]|uniref:hypothetical protein n=1 Tax=unclassified Micromonospora TaxID=2617518 RepID=UPI001182E010|nr:MULTISPECIES: hypothetical protein [unclassified Micromonospora]MDI5937939.1 hypothetical protein [Micromonospora sp. DH15]